MLGMPFKPDLMEELQRQVDAFAAYAAEREASGDPVTATRWLEASRARARAIATLSADANQG